MTIGHSVTCQGKVLNRVARLDGKQYVAVTTGNSLVSNSTNRLTPELRPQRAGPLGDSNVREG